MDAPVGRSGGCCVGCIERCQREHPAAAAQAPFASSSSSLVFPCFLRTVMEHNVRLVMAIPKAFVQQHARGLPGSTVDLEGVGGQVWLVRVVTSTTGTAEFRFGWHVFAADNSLKLGDSLLFTMVAKNRFTVRVFNRTGIESSPQTQPLLPQIVESLPQQHTFDVDIREVAKTIGDDGPSLHEIIFSSRAYERASERNRKPPRRQPVRREQTFESRRGPVTNAERASAVAAAQSLVASIAAPCIALTMTPSHVYRGLSLNIPSEFAREHLPHRTLRIELKDTWGHSWFANFDDHNGIYWAEFSMDHCLEEGDVCVLELREKHIVIVQICRVLDAPTFVPGRRGPQVWNLTYSIASSSSLPDLNEQVANDVDEHDEPPAKRKPLTEILREKVHKRHFKCPKPEPEDVHSITAVKDEPMYLVKAEEGLEVPPSVVGASAVKVKEEMASGSGSTLAVYTRRRKPEGERMWYPVVRMLAKQQRDEVEKEFLVEVHGTVSDKDVRFEQGPENGTWWVPSSHFSTDLSSCYFR